MERYISVVTFFFFSVVNVPKSLGNAFSCGFKNSCVMFFSVWEVFMADQWVKDLNS